MANMKLQSAMEYLMTYGWAILIIAVVMVALFSLGILGGSPLGTTCLPQSGYVCSNPALVPTSFNVILGQATGTNWATSNFIWVPSGTAVPSTQVCTAAVANSLAGPGYSCLVDYSNPSTALSSGQTVSLSVAPGGTAPTVGQSFSGQIWALYTTSSGGSTVYQVQVTSGVNLKTT